MIHGFTPWPVQGTATWSDRFSARLFGWSVLFNNSVVSHTRITHLRAISWPYGLLIIREVSGNLHNTVFTLFIVSCVLQGIEDLSSDQLATHGLRLTIRTNGNIRRESHVTDPEPLRITNYSITHIVVASRDAASITEQSITHWSCSRGRVVIRETEIKNVAAVRSVWSSS